MIIGKTLEELNLVDGEVIDTKEFITEIIQGDYLVCVSSLLYSLCAIYPELFNNPSFETLLNESVIKSYIPNVIKFIEEHLSLVYCSESPSNIRLKLEDAFIEIECRLSTNNSLKVNHNTPIDKVVANVIIPLEGLDDVLQPRKVERTYDLKQLARIMKRKRP